MATDVEKLIASVLARHPKPEQANALARAGDDLLANDEIDQALTVYDRVLRLDPVNAHGWTGRCAVLTRKNRTGEALGCIQRALDAEPGFGPALVRKGDLLFKMGERAQALACYDAATKKETVKAEVWINRAKVLQELERTVEAVFSLDRAIAIEETADLWRYRGDLLLELGRQEDASKSLERSVMINPEAIDVWYSLGRAKMKIGRNADAKLAFERFLALAPKEDRRYTTAQSLRDDVAKRPPIVAPPNPPPPPLVEPPRPPTAPPPPHISSAPPISSTAGPRGKPIPRSEEDSQPRVTPEPPKASKAPPAIKEKADAPGPESKKPSMRTTASGRMPSQVYAEVKALSDKGSHVEALRKLEPLVKRLPDRAEGWMLRAMLLSRLAQHDPAITSAEKALKLEPENPDALRLLAQCCLDGKKESRAVDSAEKLVALRPDDAAAHRLLGRALLAVLKPPLAVQALSKALALEPEDAGTWLEMGRALRQVRRNDDAREALRKAISLADAAHLDVAEEAKKLLEKLA